MRNKKICLFFLIAQLILIPTNIFALDSTQVQTTQLGTTYSRPVPVQVINTPLPTKVVSEPTTTRNVNVVSEPAAPRDVHVVGEPVTPRDVNVLNTVNVSATEALPVSVTNGTSDGSSEIVSAYVEFSLDASVVLFTVPLGKRLIMTDVVVQVNGSAAKGLEFSNETGVLMRFPLLLQPSSLEGFLSFNAGLPVGPGEILSVRSPDSNQSTYRLTMMGRLIDAL